MTLKPNSTGNPSDHVSVRFSLTLLEATTSMASRLDRRCFKSTSHGDATIRTIMIASISHENVGDIANNALLICVVLAWT